MRTITLILSLITITLCQAQEITVEQQNIAFKYLETSQQLIADLNQIMMNNNQLTLSRQKEEEKLKAAKKMLAEQAIEKIAKFTEEEAPENGFDLKENALSYANMMNKILVKDMNLYYIKAANKALDCNKCLPALKKAYKMQMEDYKIVDQNFEKMSESLDKVAEKHLIEIQEDDSVNDQVGKMREALDYTMVMNIGMQLAVESYNRLAKSFQKIIENKLKIEQFEKIEQRFKSDLSKVKSYMEGMTEEERSFYGDKKLWEAANKLLDNLKEIEKKELTNLKELLLNYEKNEKPDKEKLNEIVSVFGKTGGLLKKYENCRVQFLNGEFK